MTLNTTIFPDLGVPVVAGEFTRLVLGRNGDTEELRRERMEVYARRLDAIVSASPDWQQARRIVVAHSFGGMLALHWLGTAGRNALRRVDALLLIATTAGPMFRVVRPRLAGVRVPVGVFRRLWFDETVTRLGDVLLGRGSQRRVDFARLRIKNDLTVGIAGWRNTDWRARRSYRVAMDGFDARPLLRNIAVPAIVLHGTKDVYCPEAVARDLAERLPKAQLRLIPGAPHILPLTHGAHVERAVRDLLA